MSDDDKTAIVDSPLTDDAVRSSLRQLGFELERPLGFGGMAQVFLAEETDLGRKVAIKIMRDELAADDELRTRFLEEAQRVAQLEHKYILTVFRAGTVDRLRYIVMQLATEGDLSARLKVGAIAADQAADICLKLASALAYAHAEGIVHRDLKPANVFFKQDGDPILADFGIAKSLLDTSRTQIGVVIGTPRYMSPEQMRGEPVDAKTDVYALGLVFFEMMSQELPVSRGDTKQLRRSLPSEGAVYADLLARCLADDPHSRPSAQELVEELDRLKHKQANRKLLIPAAAISMVVLAALVYSLVGRDRSYDLAFELAPPDARIFVNGQRVTDSSVSLLEAEAEVAVIRRGYIGELVHIDSAQSDVLESSLAPLYLPTAGEKRRFHEVFDDEEVAVSELEGARIEHPIYAALIDLKRRSFLGDELKNDASRLQKLAALGDDAASLTLYLAATVSPQLIAIDEDIARSWIANASNAEIDGDYPGYALATHYRALGRIQERGIAEFTQRDRASVRDLLALAYFQGLDWPRDNMAWYIAMACGVSLSPSGAQQETDPAVARCVSQMPAALDACLAGETASTTPEELLLCLNTQGVAPI